MKTIIAGGRDFHPYPEHTALLDSLHKRLKISLVLSGTQRGADRFGENWAITWGIPVKQYPPDWEAHGRSAGPVRNAQMAKDADVLILFPGGAGTRNMLQCARRQNLLIVLIPMEGNAMMIKYPPHSRRSEQVQQIAKQGSIFDPDYLQTGEG
jgi:hypothetical protein